MYAIHACRKPSSCPTCPAYRRLGKSGRLCRMSDPEPKWAQIGPYVIGHVSQLQKEPRDSILSVEKKFKRDKPTEPHRACLNLEADESRQRHGANSGRRWFPRHTNLINPFSLFSNSQSFLASLSHHRLPTSNHGGPTHPSPPETGNSSSTQLPLHHIPPALQQTPPADPIQVDRKPPQARPRRPSSFILPPLPDIIRAEIRTHNLQPPFLGAKRPPHPFQIPPQVRPPTQGQPAGSVLLRHSRFYEHSSPADAALSPRPG